VEYPELLRNTNTDSRISKESEFFTRKSRISVLMRNIIRNSIYGRSVEKLIVAQLVNRYPVVPGIRWLIIFFTGTGYWTLSCAS
jgi:hypothetical protein